MRRGKKNWVNNRQECTTVQGHTWRFVRPVRQETVTKRKTFQHYKTRNVCGVAGTTATLARKASVVHFAKERRGEHTLLAQHMKHQESTQKTYYATYNDMGTLSQDATFAERPYNCLIYGHVNGDLYTLDSVGTVRCLRCNTLIRDTYTEPMAHIARI